LELKLYIVRHAHSDVAETDEARPLTSKGWAQAERLVSGFKDKALITPGVIWHSGLTRALETATGLKEGLALDCRFKKKPGLAPYDDPAAIAFQIENLTESAMIVLSTTIACISCN
jgi:phosphohistidine phosphatase SixA